MKSVKFTISVPEKVYTMFKSCIGDDEKLSPAITRAMQQYILRQLTEEEREDHIMQSVIAYELELRSAIEESAR